MKAGFKQKVSVIGPYTYTITQLDALRGRRAAVRFGKMIGPGMKSDVDGMAELAANVLAHMSEDDFDYFCDLFASQTSVKGGDYKGEPQLDAIFGMHFADRYGDMMIWLSDCITLNFSSFFGGLATVYARLVAYAAAKAKSSSQKTSTSGAGDS